MMCTTLSISKFWEIKQNKIPLTEGKGLRVLRHQEVACEHSTCSFPLWTVRKSRATGRLVGTKLKEEGKCDPFSW
jgi:hypothetical protein